MLNSQSSYYITDLLDTYAPTRNLRSSSNNLLNVPPVKLVSMALYSHQNSIFAFNAKLIFYRISETFTSHIIKN